MLRARVRRTAPLVLVLALSAATVDAQRGSGPAWLLRSLAATAPEQQSRPELLDAPVLPGSVMKAVTLVAALESGVITPATTRICRRVVTVDGVRYTCSHPDLKRPLTAAEALAHSCNDFFVSLAARLSRTSVNDVRARLGLAALAPDAKLAASLVGLDGPRMAPRAVLDMMTRLIGADARHPVPMAAATRRVLLDGLRGAASYGSASELGTRGISALAKTGTAPMPGGGVLGLTVAFFPAHEPRQAAVVAAPGAAGRDATSIAGDLLADDELSMRVGVTGTDGRVRVETIRIDDYIARVLAGEGEPRAADARAAGVGHCHSHVRARQPQPARSRRLRHVRHDALPSVARPHRLVHPRGNGDVGTGARASGQTGRDLLLGVVRRSPRACL